MLSNTCAFDTVASIFMVAFEKILNNSSFFGFISKIVKVGVTATTYSKRAEMILNNMNPSIEQLKDIKLVVCDAIASNVINVVLEQSPSIIENMTYSNKCCTSTRKLAVKYLTYTTKTDLSGLQQFIQTRIDKTNMFCRNKCLGRKKVVVEPSHLHLVIEILKWEGLLKLIQIKLKHIFFTNNE